MGGSIALSFQLHTWSLNMLIPNFRWADNKVAANLDLWVKLKANFAASIVVTIYR